MTTRFMASSLAVATLVAVTGKTGIADFPVVPQYTLIDLGSLGGMRSDALALNDGGTVVGESDLETMLAHAFRYTDRIEPIGPTTTGISSAADINGGGVIVGRSGPRVFVWRDGVASTPLMFDNPELSSTANAINDANVVAGSMGPVISPNMTSAMTYNLDDNVAFSLRDLLPAGAASAAMDINESNEVVGWVFLGSFTGFRYSPFGGVQPVPSMSFARALNDSGDVVGDCGFRACIWSGGLDSERLTLGGSVSSARGINNKAEIVGSANNALENGHAFIRSGGQMLDLNALIDTGSGLVLTVANDINEHSQIVGRAIANDNREHAFLLTPTAMPGATDVVATPVDSTTGNIPVKVSFAAITKGGVTTLTTSASGPALPPSFTAGTGGVYYRLSTSADFTTAEVRIDVEGVDLGPTPSLHQYESGTWVKVPSTFDPLTNEIRGQVTSLSTFVVLHEVSNAAPVVGAITLDPQPVIIGAAVTAAASFTDADAGDAHSGAWSWGDGLTTVASLSAGSAAGSHTFAAAGVYVVRLAVTDDDEATGASSTNATVVYGICSLYDPQRAARKGSTFPLKIQICDAAGRNLSAASIALTARGVEQISTSATGQLGDSGASNPDDNFRYDPALGTSGGYIFNLSTASLGTGTYVLRFTAGTGLYEYGVAFQVK